MECTPNNPFCVKTFFALNIYREMKYDSFISLLKHLYTKTQYRLSQLDMEPTYEIYINNLSYIM